ncbi:MAG: radical SAM protein [Candidatus Poribacteria bacterium]|nr:radical SAM protein [Candidatus Poribacteria bacterium]MDE0504346.1 radical SAM protein [Candidatus Poribacteria bacterium]
MKPNLRQTYADLLSQEHRPHHNFRKSIRSVLVYPGTYELGMSSLGVQVIYSTLNRRDDTSCERAFLPPPQILAHLRKDRTPLFSFETQTPLNQFNLLGFSVSFESDYVNIPLTLELANIPPLASDRTDEDPLIIAGGINIAYNPEPIADFVDVFVVGEAEITIHRLIDCISEGSKNNDSKTNLLRSLATIPGFYVPNFYNVDYDDDDGTIKRASTEACAPETIRSSAVANLDDVETCTQIHTPNTEFSNAHLIEIVRGCGRQCRFCVADYARRWPRHRSVEHTLKLAEMARGITDRIGLVGASISDHPQIDEIATGLVDKGFRISCASLRAETVRPPLLDALAESEQGTITIAPEVATENLQNVVNKAIPRERLYYVFEEALKRDILNLRLYFLIGVPYETAADVEAIADMAKTMRTILLPYAKSTGRMGRISFTISPMVPKPHTPFQWVAMEDPKTIARKLDFLKREINSIGGLKVSSASARLAYQEAVFARGDRRLGKVILDLSRGVPWKHAFKKHQIDPDFYALRPRSLTEVHPWDHLDLNVKPEYLSHEFKKQTQGFMTGQCDTTVCKKCGAC